MRLVCNIDAQAESDDPEKISHSLARSVESDQPRKAEQANGDGTKREEHDKSKPRNDAVRHENAGSSIGIRPAGLLESRGTAVGAAATTYASTWSRCSGPFVV